MFCIDIACINWAYYPRSNAGSIVFNKHTLTPIPSRILSTAFRAISARFYFVCAFKLPPVFVCLCICNDDAVSTGHAPRKYTRPVVCSIYFHFHPLLMFCERFFLLTHTHTPNNQKTLKKQTSERRLRNHGGGVGCKVCAAMRITKNIHTCIVHKYTIVTHTARADEREIFGQRKRRGFGFFCVCVVLRPHRLSLDVCMCGFFLALNRLAIPHMSESTCECVCRRINGVKWTIT